ncbi:LOS, partial [Symbiodinium sp. KB8]
MRVVCVLALSLSLWQGQPATVKPTEAAKSSGDPPNSAQGPHDDPWAHTYRAQRAAPEDDDPDSQPTLWLRGQHPEEHGSADAAAGPAAQIPDHTASPTPEGGSSSSGEPDPIHQPGAQPEEDANAHAAAATAAEESTSAGVTPQTEPTAAANTQHSSNATAGPEHIADSDTPTAGAPGEATSPPIPTHQEDQPIRNRWGRQCQYATAATGVAHLVGLDEEDDEESWAKVLSRGGVSHQKRCNNYRDPLEEEEEEPFLWDGLFSTMTLSAGGAPQPLTFPPEIPTAWGVDIHFRSLGYGAWAGCRGTKGALKGYMSISTAFVLFPWGKVTRGHPVKWLFVYAGEEARDLHHMAPGAPGAPLQHLCQRGSSAASSSHGPRVLQIRGVPHLTGAAAMIRRWLREFAAILRQQPMGDQVPLLLQQTMEAVGHDQETEDEGDDGTVGLPGPCKKRRILNMLYVAKVRLQDVCDDEGLDGDNQHQIRADLETALRDIDSGAIMFEQMTARQWGDQVQQGHHGIVQARKAVQAALESTIHGDLDWVTPGWGEAIGLVLQDAEELMDEEGRLDWAHPADVLAMEEGANEAPPVPHGDVSSQIDTLLRNVGAVAHFLRKGREELRRFLAAVIVWRQANHGLGGIQVDTQTTEEGGEQRPGDPEGDLSGEATGQRPKDPAGDSSGGGPAREHRGDPEDATKWIPPLKIEQWPGSVPTEDSQPSGPEQPVSPTDDDLVQALEDYERQAEQERLVEARAEAELGDTALDQGASSTEGHEAPSAGPGEGLEGGRAGTGGEEGVGGEREGGGGLRGCFQRSKAAMLAMYPESFDRRGLATAWSGLAGGRKLCKMGSSTLTDLSEGIAVGADFLPWGLQTQDRRFYRNRGVRMLMLLRDISAPAGLHSVIPSLRLGNTPHKERSTKFSEYLRQWVEGQQSLAWLTSAIIHGGLGKARPWLDKVAEVEAEAIKAGGEAEHEDRVVGLDGRGQAEIGSAAGDVKQGGYGKVPTHKNPKLDQLMRCTGLLENNIKDQQDPDVEFCDDMLGKISRSFAAVIRQLPTQLGIYICIFYLADGSSRETEKQEELIHFGEKRLGDVNCSIKGSKGVIKDSTDKMGAGMAEYVSADLAQGRSKEGLANSMGLFLQKTNIIRDYKEDYAPALVDGRAFWPQTVFASAQGQPSGRATLAPTIWASLLCPQRKLQAILGQMADSIIKRSVGAGSIAGSRLAVKAGGENLAKGVGEQAFCLCFDNHGMTFLVPVQALLCLNDLVADALELVPDSLEFTGVVKIRKGLTARLIVACCDGPVSSLFLRDQSSRLPAVAIFAALVASSA